MKEIWWTDKQGIRNDQVWRTERTKDLENKSQAQIMYGHTLFCFIVLCKCCVFY